MAFASEQAREGGRGQGGAGAADGDAGVHKMLELLEHEMGVAMALAGARSLGLSPAAVSQNLARLEAHLQVRLLTRTTRVVRVTEAGVMASRRAAALKLLWSATVRKVLMASSSPIGLLLPVK